MTPSPAEPYDFLASFLKAHETVVSDPDESAPKAFDYWFDRGYVFKSPDYLMIGGDDPDEPNQDTWFVYWAELHPRLRTSTKKEFGLAVSTFLRLMPYHRPYVKWYRGFSGNPNPKTYSTDRLLQLVSFYELQ